MENTVWGGGGVIYFLLYFRLSEQQNNEYILTWNQKVDKNLLFQWKKM